MNSRSLKSLLVFPFSPLPEFLASLGVMVLINLGITLIIYTLMDWRFFWTIFGASYGIGLGCFMVTRTTVKYFYPRFGNDLRVLLGIQPVSALVGSVFGHMFLAHTQPFHQTYATAILFSVPASLVFYFLHRISEAKITAHKATAQREKARKQTIQMELRTLQNQIEPHFLFNTLANVNALIDISPEQAKYLLSEYTDFLRDTMRVSTKTLWPLEDEINMIQRYLHIQQTRFPNIYFTIEMAPNTATIEIPPLLLQPLVENAFIHGLAPKGNIGHIDIKSRLTSTRKEKTPLLVIDVQDDGVGPDQIITNLAVIRETTSGDKVGLQNIRARLKSHYENDDGQPAASLVLTNANPGTVSTLLLPMPSQTIAAHGTPRSQS